MNATLFELTLSGGAAERIYRRTRPEIMRIPWRAPLGVRVTKAQRAAARQQWTIAALQEYQSACAQASVLAALVASRVPLDLSAVAARFPIDELAHAEICARTANALGGGAPVAFDPAKVFERPASSADLLDVTVLVARLFGVGEGWSLGFLEALRRQTRVPLLAAVWRALVRDEAVHARFAWTFLEWARETLDARAWSEVERAARAAVTEMVARWSAMDAIPIEAFSAISPLGPGDHAAYRERARLALAKRVVAPFARVGIDVTPR